MSFGTLIYNRKSLILLLVCIIFGIAYVGYADVSGRSNLPTKTLGGVQIWEDLHVVSGWRIQRNIATDHYRLLDTGDVRRAWGTREECDARLEQAKAELDLKPASDHAVVLLHGLGRSKRMYVSLERALREEGYEVVTINYPGTRRSIEEHAAQVEIVLENLEGISRVSFITHSLGSIVMRSVLSRDGAWKETIEPIRLVMMGPPNQGSVIARMLPAETLEIVLGSTLKELQSVGTQQFPVPPIDFAIIAGGRGGEGYNPLIPGDDDGVVGVEEARLAGASAFLVVEGIHSFLPSNEAAARAAVHFLETGEFE